MGRQHAGGASAARSCRLLGGMAGPVATWHAGGHADRAMTLAVQHVETGAAASRAVLLSCRRACWSRHGRSLRRRGNGRFGKAKRPARERSRASSRAARDDLVQRPAIALEPLQHLGADGDHIGPRLLRHGLAIWRLSRRFHAIWPVLWLGL